MRYPLQLISSRCEKTLEDRLKASGVDAAGIEIIKRKADNLIIRIEDVPAPAANILKQDLLALGGDAAVHRDAITGRVEKSIVYIIADRRRISRLPAKLRNQPFGLAELAADLERLLRLNENPPERIAVPGGEIDLTNGPIIMGVINVTPDSFSDGGLYLEPESACERALEMMEEGASIIDVGGESSRPGSGEVGADEELERVMPVLERLAGRLNIPVSIDTRKAEVARAAVQSGASIINDISGFKRDGGMAGAALETGAAVILMHMQGTPEMMQDDPHYEDAVSEILSWMSERTAELTSSGVGRDKIIVDPGIGFGKRLEDNLAILHEIGDFRSLGYPVMVGYSRKSFIGSITGRRPFERLWGGFAALASCLNGGVQIVRVHDVRETADFIKVWKEIERRGCRR